MASATPTPNPASPPHRQPIPGANPASPPNKRDLKSWWKGFKLPSKHQETQETRAPGIFGIPLRQSITYANVAISLIDEHGQSYIYGYVPIVVAKCGVFLKEKATGIEGIFRLSGSEKRIKELKLIFDSPDRYGKGLVWDGYTVHDAANVLRRYLNDLPEPVVPLDLYEKFRDPLRGATKQAVGDTEGPQFVENFNEMAAIERYQNLITELPPLNRQLLLYILDLLAVFAAKSDENRMNSQNLAAIFQPGMLSHPAHAMAPEEYRLNQCVIIFLIENQDHFLIGMQGTAADENTKKEVESGTPKTPHTPNTKRSSGIGRTASNASAGAESVRRDGKLRRNQSVASKHSKKDGASTPNSPALATTPTGGLGRSNTVPSKKSPALAGSKFKKHESTSHHSPAHIEPLTQARPVEELDESGTPIVGPSAHTGGNMPRNAGGAMARGPERLLDIPQEIISSKDRNAGGLFQRSPTEGNEKRQPNKLKKKRIPGALNQSAHSSSVSLTQPHSNAASPHAEIANPMDQIHSIVQAPTSHPLPPPVSSLPSEPVELPATQAPGQAVELEAVPPQAATAQQPSISPPPQPITEASQITPDNTLHPGNTLGGKKSPPASLHSSFNEGSDLDQHADDQHAPSSDNIDKEKKKRWRLSRAKRDDNASSGSPSFISPQVKIGTNDNAEISVTSIGSASHKPRKSFTGESSEHVYGSTDGHDGSRDDRDDSKGPIGWIRNKYREAKENAEQRRNKSPPPPDRQGFGAAIISRGKSMDIKRDQRDEEKHAQQSAPVEASVVAPREKETIKEVPNVEDELQKEIPAVPQPQITPAAAALVEPQPSQVPAQPQVPAQHEAPVLAPAPPPTQPQAVPAPQHEVPVLAPAPPTDGTVQQPQ